MISFALAIAAAQAEPSYAEALRCFGLTMGEAVQLKVSDQHYATVFDSSVDWKIIATGHAIAERITPERFAEDQEAALDKAEADLKSGGAALRAELAACIANGKRR